MIPSQNGYGLIAREEGCVLHPYQCSAGKATIGYGSRFYEDGTPVTMHDATITKERAYKLMMLTANRFATRLSSFIRVPVTQNQFDAILSLVYNAGAIIYKSTLIRKLNSGNYAGAANEFSKWTHVNGKVDPGLVSRRARERALFMTE
jgi:lysozyme